MPNVAFGSGRDIPRCYWRGLLLRAKRTKLVRKRTSLPERPLLGAGAEWIRKAALLDPHGAHARAHLLGRALYGSRHYADAADAYRQITAPRYGQLADMAACYAQMGRDAEAKEQAAAALRLKPDFAIDSYLQTLPYRETADRNHLEDGLRRAGLPE